MPTPLPMLPTASQQAGTARGTEWGTLFLGLALGAVLTCVVALAGLCGGWLGWSRSNAKARRRAALDHELHHPGYLDFLVGNRPVGPISPVSGGRASTAVGDEHDQPQIQQGIAASVAEPEVTRRR